MIISLVYMTFLCIFHVDAKRYTTKSFSSQYLIDKLNLCSNKGTALSLQSMPVVELKVWFSKTCPP